MLKSLYAGVSGLTNHQMKLDVLGNNIANINTVGYKGARIHFSEALNQTITNATPSFGTGYINPVQVGLGMKTSSIENVFSQGSLENTGIITDLAIEGDGFFVLQGGDNRLFTRAGQFYFNSNGKLVNQRGLGVQGWILNDANQTAGLNEGNMSDIVIDSNMVSEAVQTSNVYLTGNLNAGLQTTYEVWESPSENAVKASVTGSVIAGATTITAGTNDQIKIELKNDASTTINEELTLTAGTYADTDALVAEINTQIAANSNLDGRVEAVNSGGSVQFRQVGGTSTTQLTVYDGTNSALTDLGFTNGDSGSASIAASTADLNSLIIIEKTADALVAGDTIEISGTNPDGSLVNATFTYGAANDGTTLDDLINVIESNFTGVSVSYSDGKIVLKDDVAGDSKTTINLSNGSNNTGTINFPSFANTTPGETGRATSSVIVYDSLGTGHNMVIEFTKTTTDNLWTWQVTPPGDEKILSGGTGTVRFDENGALISFNYDGGVNELTMDPGNGSDLVQFALHAEASDEFRGLSQFDSVSTVSVREQDGRAMGTLLGITVARDGVIAGSFSNGEIELLAKVAMAKFANNAGLNDLGDGLYQTSIASGNEKIIELQDDVGSSIVSGALEMSNVDLSQEFTNMITTQRGFQANAKVISTADQLLDELIRLKR